MSEAEAALATGSGIEKELNIKISNLEFRLQEQITVLDSRIQEQSLDLGSELHEIKLMMRLCHTAPITMRAKG
jgi:hypothetical protein